MPELTLSPSQGLRIWLLVPLTSVEHNELSIFGILEDIFKNFKKIEMVLME